MDKTTMIEIVRFRTNEGVNTKEFKAKMMKYDEFLLSIKTKSLVFIATLVLLTSCATYAPQVVDIPLIKEKGDIRIDAGCFFLAPDREGYVGYGGHTTISAGLTNMLAVQGYASGDVMGKNHIQGALGLFRGLENKTVIELYSGYGYGAGLNFDRINENENKYKNKNKNKNSYHLTFAQFNIGKTDLRIAHIDFGFGMKGGYLNNNLVEIGDKNTPIQKKNGWIVEPSVFFRFGGKKVKFSTRVNYLWTDVIEKKYYFPLSVGLGVNIYLGTTSKRK